MTTEHTPADTPAARTDALERELEEHGHIHHEDVDAAIVAREMARETGDGPSPALGATIVARAWTDPEFRDRLLTDGTATLGEYAPMPVPVAVMENTQDVHHVIVCTLCSCYPGAVLGDPPAWYKSFEYRSRVVREPRAVLSEFGMDLDDDVEVRIVDSTSEQRYMVLPLRPEGTDGWSAEQLAALVTRNSMIGTGRPITP
jgi:nitrile hydratase